ncbi:MAG: ATP-dependent Clp protease ATP-binding subunit [Patescibacteria group bacterium]|nr:ATP-dependent Clp protease ATP-binding subunit [Patescibacteria group bacterium]
MGSDFQFNLKKTEIYRAVVLERNMFFKFRNIFRKLFLVLFFIFLGLLIYLSFTSRRLLGFSILFFVLYISAVIKSHFLDFFKKPKQLVPIEQALSNLKEYNLAEFLGFETAKAVSSAIKLCRSKGLSKTTSSALLYFLIKNNPKLNFVFSRALLNIKDIEKKLLDTVEKSEKGEFKPAYCELFKHSMLEALENAKNKNHSRIRLFDILAPLSKHNSVFKQVLIDTNLKSEDISNLSNWLERVENELAERKKFFEWKNLIRSGSLGKEWSTGYTVNLDRFSADLSERAKAGVFSQIIGHEKEIKAVERTLAKEKENNVLLVGEQGSGRRIIIEDLAKKSFLGESIKELNYKRIIELDLSLLLTQVTNSQQAGEVLNLIFDEAVSAGNVILVINDFHNFVGGVQRPGALDITSIISPYLNLPQFRIIAVTSFKGLHKYIEQNPSILTFFGKVEVREISQEQSLTVLENLVFQKEVKYKQFISYPALRDIIKFSEKYLAESPFPEKAIDLLDDVVSYVSQIKEKIVLPKHVAAIVSEKTEIPVGEIETKEREKLLNLEALIHKRIINQETAVKEVAEALRRARTDISIRKGPMGAFLFLGPTGVGKTETAKSLTKIYFGKEQKMIRLDMSEFQEISDIERLIGSIDKEGLLTTKVIEDPFSLVLLDEIEKAHPNILNLFLQVIDEGHLTDGLGRKVSFKNTIIIATSNAGYLVILDALRENKKMEEIREDLINYLFKEKIFRPEFINRFDAVVLFKVLTKENLLAISGLLLNKLKKNLAKKDIEFIITDSLKKKIVELSYDPKFGARQMNRVIQDKIGNVFAKALLSNEIKRGDRAELEAEDFKLKVNP